MKNKVETLAQVAQRMMFELEQIKTLAIGQMELVKLLPGYEEALEQLKEQHGKEEDTSGAATGDSGSITPDLELE